MILHRRGAKTKIADEIIQYFPIHELYIEPFFGAGGIFFNKPKVQYNIMNDIDSDVFNVFMMIKDYKEDLNEALLQCPIHSDLLDYWKLNKETDPIQKAVRFLFLSNYTLYGNGETLKIQSMSNNKKILLENIWVTYKMISDVRFTNFDFRKFIKSISFETNRDLQRGFIYADPPYLSTSSNYSQNFNEKDSLDLFECLENKGCKWAMSELEHPFILKQIKQRNLNMLKIKEKRNLMSDKKVLEILITNYENNLKPMF